MEMLHLVSPLLSRLRVELLDPPGCLHDLLQGHGLGKVTSQLEVAGHEGGGGRHLSWNRTENSYLFRTKQSNDNSKKYLNNQNNIYPY